MNVFLTLHGCETGVYLKVSAQRFAMIYFFTFSGFAERGPEDKEK